MGPRFSEFTKQCLFTALLLSVLIVPGLQATLAQEVVNTVPGQTVYEYQLNYKLPWQVWYGGPGLSFGGTMPTRGVFGYSTLNGIPFPGPLGAGAYLTAPPPNGVAMPGPMAPGLSPMMMGGPMLGAMGGPGMGMPGMQGMAGSRVMPPNESTANGMKSKTPQQLRNAIQTSSPAARRVSLEQQNLGDAKLRDQQWAPAYVHYRNAVDLAPDRPEARFRLALSFAALKQYSSAIREFKRCLEIDPTLPQSGDRLSTIFGENNKIPQASLLPTVADWAREDLNDGDRLFLLGLLLYYNDDPRGSEMLEAAARTSGPKDYIQVFLNPPDESSKVLSRSPVRSTSPPPAPNPVDVQPLLDDAIPPSPTFSEPDSSQPTPDPPPT